ncbi:hypothetical protein [Bacillus phage BC-T25]|nr:hypothetical protein [Bacillus phage BC-T25]
MAKERSNNYSNATITVWLEGTHIETYRYKVAEGTKEWDWVKTYDRKEKLAEQIKSAHMELQALESAHILLQEENKCSTSSEKTAE